MSKDINDNMAYLQYKVEKGWEKKNIPTTQEYIDRVKYEISVISDMNFCDYFLIIEDIVSWAKGNGIPAGPGRGSGAGSIVCYALDITTIDPIRFGLFFERFLNPSRISMPDLDLDFCTVRRGEIVKHLEEKYGSDRVANIISFGKMWPRAAIKDTARALKVKDNVVVGERIAKMFPSTGHEFEEAVEKSKLLQEEKEKYPDLFAMASKLSGKPRNTSVHPAGVVITPEPLVEYFPLYYGAGNKDSYASITQWDMYDIEETGFVKVDLLGLNTLTIMSNVVKRVNENRPDENKFDLEDISLENKEALKLFADGRTTGLFQLERKYVQDFCKNMGIANFMDVVVMNAIIRPGTMDSGMTDEFIARRKGENEVTYPHPSCTDALSETYGILVYQEQAMQISRDYAGFSLAEADNLRKAIGKKIPEKMAEAKKAFIESAVEKSGHDAAKAEEIFELIETFERYGFNKSHAVAYGKITFQSAYLKTHFPVMFMCELLNGELGNSTSSKVEMYIDEAKRMGIDVIPPSIDSSETYFSIINDGKDIEFGLAFIKSVSPKAVSELIKHRKHATSFTELLLKINMTKLNSKGFENLINAGVFDKFNVDRDVVKMKYDVAKKMVAKYKDQQKRKKKGTKLRSELNTEEILAAEVAVTRADLVEKRTLEKVIKDEHEACSAYVTQSPFMPFLDTISEAVNTDIPDIEGGFARNLKRVCVAGVIQSINEILTKRGKNPGQEMAFLSIAHHQKSVEGVVFPEPYATLKESLVEDKVYLFYGEMNKGSFIITKAELLSTI